MNTSKTLSLLGVLLLSFAIAAQSSGDGNQPATGPVIATTLFSDGGTNTWTQADLIAALQLINRKYHRDCETGSGRAAWHGRLKRQSVVTNDVGELVKTEYHDDGQTFAFTSRIVTAEARVKAANAQLKTTMKRGVPAALAAARARREAEKTAVSNVTVTVEANTRQQLAE